MKVILLINLSYTRFNFFHFLYFSFFLFDFFFLFPLTVGDDGVGKVESGERIVDGFDEVDDKLLLGVGEK